MKLLPALALTGVCLFAALQAVRPAIPSRPATAELQTPPAVHQILVNSCYSCHSDQPRLSWFDQIVPGYWLVRHDILKARHHLDFSTLGAQPAAAQRATLFEAVNMIQLGTMPLPSFTRLHPDAKVTPAQLAVVNDYLAPWSALPTPPPSTATPAAAPIDLHQVSTGFANVAFDPDFESWKLVSTTDRGDNNTFRFILGNPIAVQAIQSGNISPWPDGARLAKVAWQQQLGPDGLVHAGSFIQVELMVKDAARYKTTEGWGWGRWRGLDLKPYGKSAAAINECTSCHLPVHGNDYVYTLPITQAKVDRQEIVNNHAAALPATLPWQPLGWHPITLFVDRNTHTASTLFANDAALPAFNARPSASQPSATLPAGAVLALVSWAQRDDPHWFGARIPDSPTSVEFLETTAAAENYRVFQGPTLAEEHPNPSRKAERIALLRSLRPAPLP